MILQEELLFNVNFVNKMLLNIIDFLQENKIVNKNKIEELKILIKYVNVHINNFEEEYIEYKLLLENGKYLPLTLKNTNTCNVIIFPPQICNSKIIKIFPIFNIVKFSNCDTLIKKTFHESCHLFSISNYDVKQLENKIEIKYTCGSEKVFCNYINEKQNKFLKTDYGYLNEIFNDIVAEYLYVNIQNDNYKNYKRVNFNHFIESLKFVKEYIGDNTVLFVKNYFESNLKGNFEFFKRDFQSFKILNSYLLNNIKR